MRIYVAGVDLAGEAEEGEDAMLRAIKPRQDSTVVTIGELDFSTCNEVVQQPFEQSIGVRCCYSDRINIVEHYWWSGNPHTSLYPQLVDLLKNLWGCRRVVVDATGVGAGVSSFLQKALGRSIVTPFLFTQQSKSRLGFALLAAINSGRVKMYAADGTEEYRQFWTQMERAKSVFRPSQTMNFYVAPAEGHDDFLMSLALLIEASEYKPRSARGGFRE